MRAVLQRVSRAEVSVDGVTIGKIEKGFMILLGVSDEDTESVADKLADKICRLRIFADENGKTNLALADVGGSILAVSQFTLFADCKKGNRPGFTGAGAPDHAKHLYEHFAACCEGRGIKTQMGSFGADMQVELCNDGPFTLMLDSSQLFG